MFTATNTKHYTYNDYRHNPISFYDDIAIDVLSVITSTQFVDQIKNAPVEADHTNTYDMSRFYRELLQEMRENDFMRADLHSRFQDFLARLIHTMYASNAEWPSKAMSVEAVRHHLLNSLINIEQVAYSIDFREKTMYYLLSELEFAAGNKSAEDIAELQKTTFFIAVIAYLIVA